MALPTNKKITQEFGSNFLVNGRWAYGSGGHNGMDFAVYYERWNCPSIILTITYTGFDGSGFGNLVKGRDQYGYIHWFAHNSAFLVSPGQTISLGQAHSISGNTGFSTAPHGHWGVQLPGSSGYNGFINPRNWPGFNETEMGVPQERLDREIAASRLARRNLVGYVYLQELGRPPTAKEVDARQDQNPETMITEVKNSQEAAEYRKSNKLIQAKELAKQIENL